jgi:hypothetical protein
MPRPCRNLHRMASSGTAHRLCGSNSLHDVDMGLSSTASSISSSRSRTPAPRRLLSDSTRQRLSIVSFLKASVLTCWTRGRPSCSSRCWRAWASCRTALRRPLLSAKTSSSNYSRKDNGRGQCSSLCSWMTSTSGTRDTFPYFFLSFFHSSIHSFHFTFLPQQLDSKGYRPPVGRGR